MTGLFLGIDGGATSGKWTVFNEKGVTVSKGTSFPIDGHIYNENSKARLISFLSLIEPRRRVEVVGIFCGLTGISTSSNVEEIRALFKTIFPNAKVHIEQDVLLGYRTHFVDHDGVFLYAGTGSVAIIRRNGKFEDVGGWGFILGDEGAGFWIGVQALRKYLIQIEKRQSFNRLSITLSQELRLSTWDQIREFAYSKDRSEIANLSKVVIKLASEGEEESLKILDGAISELVLLVNRAKNVAGLSDTRIVFGGGIARSHPIVKEHLQYKLSQEVLLSDVDYSVTAAKLAQLL